MDFPCSVNLHSLYVGNWAKDLCTVILALDHKEIKKFPKKEARIASDTPSEATEPNPRGLGTRYPCLRRFHCSIMR